MPWCVSLGGDPDRTFVSSCERAERNISLFNIYRLVVAIELEPAELMREPTDHSTSVA